MSIIEKVWLGLPRPTPFLELVAITKEIDVKEVYPALISGMSTLILYYDGDVDTYHDFVV